MYISLPNFYSSSLLYIDGKQWLAQNFFCRVSLTSPSNTFLFLSLSLQHTELLRSRSVMDLVFFSLQPLFSEKSSKQKENRRTYVPGCQIRDYHEQCVHRYEKSRRIRTEKNAFEMWELRKLTSERSFSGKCLLEDQRIGHISILGLSAARLQQTFQLPLLLDMKVLPILL